MNLSIHLEVFITLCNMYKEYVPDVLIERIKIMEEKYKQNEQ